MNSNSNGNPDVDHMSKIACQYAGYLPIPLRDVPPQSLAALKVYLLIDQKYQLYRNTFLHFEQKDYDRLLESGVDYVYIPVDDHEQYFRTVEEHLETIISNPQTQVEQKAKILYSTSMELANHLLKEPPGKGEVDRATKVSRATVKLILQNNKSFNNLFKVSNHDFYTATHLVNVCTNVIGLAQRTGIVDSKSLNRIGTGGLLHDVGKIFIPTEILNSPKTLTSEQHTLVRSHVDRGCEHLSRVDDFPDEVMDVVSQHHERMDGSGYPRGLKGDKISIYGRLAGIVDTFEAMTSVRPYRKEVYSFSDAMQQLEDESPDKYDTDIVRVFNRLMDQQFSSRQAGSDGSQEDYLYNGAEGTSKARKDEYPQYHFRLKAKLRNINYQDQNFTFEPSREIVLHTISRSELELLSPHPIVKGQNICVTVARGKPLKTFNLIAQVKCCMDHTNGWYTVKARFHKLQTDELINDIKEIS